MASSRARFVISSSLTPLGSAHGRRLKHFERPKQIGHGNRMAQTTWVDSRSACYTDIEMELIASLRRQKAYTISSALLTQYSCLLSVMSNIAHDNAARWKHRKKHMRCIDSCRVEDKRASAFPTREYCNGPARWASSALASLAT